MSGKNSSRRVGGPGWATGGWESLQNYYYPSDVDNLVESSQKPSQEEESWDDFPSNISDDESDISDDESDISDDESDISDDDYDDDYDEDIKFDLNGPDWWLDMFGMIKPGQTWMKYPYRRSTRYFLDYKKEYFKKDDVDDGYSVKEIQESEKHRYELKKLHKKVKLQANYYSKIRKALKIYIVGLSMEEIELVVESTVLDKPLFIGNGKVEIADAAGTKYKKYFKKKEKGKVAPLEIYVKGQLTLREFFEELISYRLYIEETHELKKNAPTNSPPVFYFGHQMILGIKSKGFLKAKTCGYNCVKLYISWGTINFKKLIDSFPIDELKQDMLIQNGKVDESRYKYKKLHKKMNLKMLTNPDILYTLTLYDQGMRMYELKEKIKEDFYTTSSILNIPLITGKGKIVLHEPYKYKETMADPLEIFIDGKLTFREFFEILIDNSPKVTTDKPYFITSLLTRGLFSTKKCGYNCVQMKLKWSNRKTPLLDKLRSADLRDDLTMVSKGSAFVVSFLFINIMIDVVAPIMLQVMFISMIFLLLLIIL